MPSFTLPDHVDINPETIQAIAIQHGLTASTVKRLSDARTTTLGPAEHTHVLPRTGTEPAGGANDA